MTGPPWSLNEAFAVDLFNKQRQVLLKLIDLQRLLVVQGINFLF